MKNSKKYFALALGLVASACTYDFPEQAQPSPGEANFTKMISVGSGLTAGFMNGALYTDGQNASFAAILAKQMQQVGGGTFNQPNVNSANGCYNPAGGCTAGRLYLKTDPVKGPSPTPKPGDNGAALAPYGDKANLNNFGVPSFPLQLLLTPLTGGPAVPANPAYNPYYARIASNPGTSKPIDDIAGALANGGTFFTFWMGNDDVLGYATAGGSAAIPLTPEANFNTMYNTALGALLAASPNAKGAVANIPDLTSLPYFSTVAWNPVPLDAATAAQLNGSLGANYNAFLDYMASPAAGNVITAAEAAARKVSFAASKTNPILINDETLTNLEPYMAGPFAGLKPYAIARQTKNTDLVCLSAGSYIGVNLGGGVVLGVSAPLANPGNALKGDDLILIPSEITEIAARIVSFNNIISKAVNDNAARLVLVDANTVLRNLKTTPTTINGSAITASISPPFGGFSLDGVHPNARGNGYLANTFIDAINVKFGASIPQCNPNDYAGNELP